MKYYRREALNARVLRRSELSFALRAFMDARRTLALGYVDSALMLFGVANAARWRAREALERVRTFEDAARG